MSVTRKLPNTDAGRALALDKAALKISLTAPADIVFSAQAQALLATVRASFNTNLALRGAALSNQAELTPGKDADRRMAGLWISHFVEAHDKAAVRGEPGFVLANRSFFQLDATNQQNPPLATDDEVYLWGDRVLAGDVLRIAAGKPVIPFPASADVAIKYNLFSTSFGSYNATKTAYDNAQEAISSARPVIDGLILRLWNEAEAFFSTQDAPSRRRHCRDWGVVYVLVAGSLPTADDFSLTGKVGVELPGSPVPLAEVQVLVIETNSVSYSQPDGDYFVAVQPPGTYTIQFAKPGFITQTFNNVVIEAGVLLQNNVALVPVVTAGVSGTVLQAGVPVAATVSIVGTALSAMPNPTGYYTIQGIIPGTGIVVRTQLTGVVPPAIQEQTINLNPGESLEVIFMFP